MDRQSLAARIKALLLKTTENGCTESEALLAAEKAQELLQLYQMSLSDLDLEAEGCDFARRATDYHKTYKGLTKDAVRHLHFGCAAFTDCEATTNNSLGDSVTGLRSDLEFYYWLHDALCSFVQRALLLYALEGTSKRDRDNFVNACAVRIRHRMMDEVRLRRERQEGVATVNALVISKRGIILRRQQQENLQFNRGGWDGSTGNGHSAGAACGDRAGFGRPLSTSRSTPRIGRS